jgi:iron complex outermembrane receptor protein
MKRAHVLQVGCVALAGLAAAFFSIGAGAQATTTAVTATAAGATIAAASSTTAPTPAPAPPATAASTTETVPNELDEVVVTGTSIRGVAPVGSNLITLGRDQIDQTGAQTIQQILRDIPAVTGQAATPQGGNPGNAFYAPTIHGIGSSSSNATLVLVDGHRISPGSQQQTLTDPNIIPPIMLERVEVLAEGASSTYGSDAVAGVVNFITRKNFDGVLITGQGGVGDDYHTQTAGALWGTHWDDSSLMIGYNYSYRSDLAYSARSFLDRNHIAQGGTNSDTFNCNPASIQPAGQSLIFLSPTATAGVKNTAANAPCQNVATGDILPAEQRNNAMLKFTKALNPNLDLGVDVVVSSVTNNTQTARGSVTATVYGPGCQALTACQAGQINPFFQQIPGITTGIGSVEETVRYDSDALLGAGQANSFNNNNDYYVAANFEYRLAHDFRVTGLSLFGGEQSYVGNTGELCTSCAYLGLNGTPNSAGNPATSAVPGTSTIISNQPLTAANALDVWNPKGSNLTSAAVLANLTNNVTDSRWYYSIVQQRLGVDGSLFTLPGGPLKVAAGIEWVHYGVDMDKTYPNNAGPSSLESQTFLLDLGRNVESAYAEMLFPIIGEDNALPFVRKLSLDASGRYDDYVGLAVTSNPHVGLAWESFQGVTFRANYSTSFVAPQLTSVGDQADGGLTSFSAYGGSNTQLIVPIANFPLAAQLGAIPGSGVTCGATTCTVSSSVNGITANGGPAHPEPGRGQSWSVGFDLAPSFLPHFQANFALFNVNLSNQISGNSASNAENVAALNNDLVFFPNGTSVPNAVAAIGIPASWPQNSAINTTNGLVYYALSVRQQNLLNLYIQGVDADAHYTYPTVNAGIYRIGGSVTYFTKFNQNIAGGPNFSVLNTTGFNNTFPSIQLQGRGDLGWDLNPVSTDLFVNFVGAYRNWSSSSVAPVIDQNGVPVSGGDWVAPTITLDLHAAYNFGGGGSSRLGSSQVYLDVTNLLNSPPAFYNGANGYDSYAGNIIGRVVSAGFRVRL